ncbi:MAG: hypothetical protein KDK62_02955, partial [Chlamydiia bacterium]|nr:hypothetical protein [Chlamydiia bacterium]
KTLQKYKKAIERFEEVCRGLQIIKYPKYDTPRIIDKFIPFPKLLLSYFFLSPYVQQKIPNLAEVVEVYRNLIEKRSMATPIIKRDPEVTYYALYIEDRLVVHKCQSSFGVLFPEVFEDSLRQLTNEEIVEALGVRIDDSMINACLNRGLIPPAVKKFLGNIPVKL